MTNSVNHIRKDFISYNIRGPLTYIFEDNERTCYKSIW